MHSTQYISVNVNIECSHIEFIDGYNAILSKDSYRQAHISAELAMQLRNLLDLLQQTYSLSILIDNKEYAEEQYEAGNREAVRRLHQGSGVIPRLLSLVTEQVDEVDYVCFETNLGFYLPQLFERLPNNHAMRKRRRKVTETYRERGVMPCYIDIAIWHLLRLGYFETIWRQAVPDTVFPLVAMRGGENRSFIAPRIISILHIDYRNVEDQAKREILTHFPEFESRIGRIYFDNATNNLSEAIFDFDVAEWGIFSFPNIPKTYTISP